MTTQQDIHDAGYDRGFNLASWQDLPEIGTVLPRHVDWQGIGTVDDVDDACEAFEMCCFEAESGNRDFTPFEFTAHDLNELDQDESLGFEPWEVFDEAITEGIRANWESRKDYYAD